MRWRIFAHPNAISNNLQMSSRLSHYRSTTCLARRIKTRAGCRRRQTGPCCGAVGPARADQGDVYDIGGIAEDVVLAREKARQHLTHRAGIHAGELSRSDSRELDLKIECGAQCGEDFL